MKLNIKTGLAIAAFWLLPSAVFCQELDDAGIPAAGDNSPAPFTGKGAPPTTTNVGSSVFLGNSSPPMSNVTFGGNVQSNTYLNGPPPSTGGPPTSNWNGSPNGNWIGSPSSTGDGNNAGSPTSNAAPSNAGSDKALPLQTQVARLESTVFGHSSENVPLMTRVTTLEGKIFGTGYDTNNKSLEDRVQHLWQAVNPASAQADNNNSNPFAAITAFLSPIAEGAQSLFRIARPPDQDTGAGANGMDGQTGMNPMGANPMMGAPMGSNQMGANPMIGAPMGSNQMGANPMMGAPRMASVPPPNFSLSVPTNLFATPPVSPPVPFLNAGVLEFVRRNMGQRVGNGECWTLAAEALKFAGAEPAQQYTFGRALSKNEQWVPGDIIQFTSCVFKYKVGNSTSIMKAGAPNHTAVMWGRDNGLPVIAQQNHNGVKTVDLQTIDLDSLIKGKFQIYRPIPLGPP